MKEWTGRENSGVLEAVPEGGMEASMTDLEEFVH